MTPPMASPSVSRAAGLAEHATALGNRAAIVGDVAQAGLEVPDPVRHRWETRPLEGVSDRGPGREQVRGRDIVLRWRRRRLVHPRQVQGERAALTGGAGGPD